MNLFKRSFLYVIRKKRKSITLFVCLWLVASTLISGIAVKMLVLLLRRHFQGKLDQFCIFHRIVLTLLVMVTDLEKSLKKQ